MRKFSTKKFLSNALCSGVGLGVGVPAAAGEVAAVVVVVVAGDIAAVEGVIPGAGERPGTVAVALGAVVVVVVAGAVAGLIAGAGAVVVVAGAVAGLVAVVGGAAGARVAGEVAGGGGGGWPKELKAMVTEKRLAISVVFIELIEKLFRPRIPMSWTSS